MEKSRSSGVPTSGDHHYPDLHILFDFFTDNPQKVMPGDVNSPNKDSPFYDPYWEAVRTMQSSEHFLEGILLRSVDCKPRYPYVHYIVYKNSGGGGSSSSSGGGGSGGVGSVSGGLLQKTSTSDVMKRRSHDSLNNSRVPLGAAQATSVREKEFGEILKSRGGYRELHTFVDRQTPLLPKRPSNPNTAYILSAFMTSGNLDNLDKTWSYWSGADYIVENIPPALKLERVTFHKIINSGGGAVLGAGGPVGAPVAPGSSDFSYVLLCELGEALADLNRAREFIDHLKFRQCGVSSLYVIDHFF